MGRRLTLRASLLTFVIILSFSVTSSAFADGFVEQHQVTNSTNRSADDLHVTLGGTGGTLHDAQIVVNAPGCAGKVKAGFPKAQGNKVDVEWTEPCVDPGESVEFSVHSLHPNTFVVEATWTKGGITIPPTGANTYWLAPVGIIVMACGFVLIRSAGRQEPRAKT